MILFPAIDLRTAHCVRLKLGDMDQATVYNDDPAAQAKAFEDQGFRVAARRRPERRLRRRSRQWRGGRGDPEGDEEPGAARRRHPHARPYRGLAREGPGARHPRHGRGARSGSGQGGLPALSPARSPSASTRAAARSRSRAGRRHRRSASIELAQEIRGRRRRRHHLHRHRPRRRARPASTGKRRSSLPTRCRSRSSPPAASPRSPTSCA